MSALLAHFAPMFELLASRASKSFLEGVLGENTGMIIAILVVVLVVVVVAFIAKGFFDEMKK